MRKDKAGSSETGLEMAIDPSSFDSGIAFSNGSGIFVPGESCMLTLYSDLVGVRTGGSKVKFWLKMVFVFDLRKGHILEVMMSVLFFEDRNV
jgi:hypothetical protein